MLDRTEIALLMGFAWLAASGCGGGPASEQPEAGALRPGGVLVSDQPALLLAELEEADREFARAVRERGLEAWVEGFAEDGSIAPADGPVVRGREAIRELYAPLFADPTFEYIWEPVGGRVASSGDLGYTFGEWSTRSGDGGRRESAAGRYVTVWTRGADGHWRVLFDLGNVRHRSDAASGAGAGG